MIRRLRVLIIVIGVTEVAVNNLAKRAITAVILIPLVLFLALRAPASWLGLLLMVIIVIGFYEFFKLAKTSTNNQIIIVIIAILFSGIMLISVVEPLFSGIMLISVVEPLFSGIMLISVVEPLFSGIMLISVVEPIFLLLPLLLIVAFWAKNLYLIFNYPKITPSKNNFLNGVNAVFLITPLTVLWLFNKDLLLLLLLIVWGADSFAYFVGKALGRRKLAPKLSTGKTTEGLLGGLFAAIILALIWLHFNDIALEQYYKYLLLTVITALFSVAGDLYESIYKREAGVKDSGSILLGHGGILDRIDGLLGAIPVFSIGMTFL